MYINRRQTDTAYFLYFLLHFCVPGVTPALWERHRAPAPGRRGGGGRGASSPGRRARVRSHPSGGGAGRRPTPSAPVSTRPLTDAGAFSSLWLSRTTVLAGERRAFVEAKDSPGPSGAGGRPRARGAAGRASALRLCLCPPSLLLPATAALPRPLLLPPRGCRQRVREGTVLAPGHREITKASC